jgi:hypothetical protein
MALEIFTVRVALEGALVRLALLETDLRLDAAERALVSELIQADTLALNALRADDMIVPGQRTARAQQIEDKVFALDTVETAHDAEIGIDAFYNALDLSQDAARAIRDGLPTFLSDISTTG